MVPLHKPPSIIIGNHVGAIIGKGIEEVQMIILRVQILAYHVE